jgi:hypothetical protein
MKNRLWVFFLAFYLISCQSIQNNKHYTLQWSYSDLRGLDPVDATFPAQDLIALYTRFTDQLFQIRMDMLDLNLAFKQDIYIAIDTQPGGTSQFQLDNINIISMDINWDYLIIIPASGNIKIIDENSTSIDGIKLMILRDPSIDAIIVSFDKNSISLISGLTKIQVLINPPSSQICADRSEPILIDETPPPRVKVLFAFWNSFQAFSPAQTLRSWDGAHAGPMSSRHGLSYLIEAAAQSEIPILLLDLNKPDLLSAIDYLNVMPRILELAGNGILELPDFIPVASFPSGESPAPFFPRSDIISLDLINSKNVANSFGLRGSLGLFSYSESGVWFICEGGVSENWCGGNGYAQFFNHDIPCDLSAPTPGTNLTALDRDFPINCIRLLISYAFSSPNGYVLFGGDFSKSVLGDPDTAYRTFQYISSHPWIQPLLAQDFLMLSDGNTPSPLPLPTVAEVIPKTTLGIPIPSGLTASQINNYVQDALLHSPPNQITNLAWQVYYSLLTPASPTLISLRSNYLGQIGHILAAAQWAEFPSPRADCNVDLDWDGTNECILASTDMFTSYESEGGYIAFAFHKDQNGLHQMLGATWEFNIGISDPSTWDIDAGIIGDPDQVLGSFVDSVRNWHTYQLYIESGKVRMVSPEMSMRKSFTLVSGGIHIDIENLTSELFTARIPLVVDPWIRFTSGWGDRYAQTYTQFGWQWGIVSGENVELRTQNEFIGYAFTDTHEIMAYPEDPNYDYPPGHYLPFPMALVEINDDQNISVDILVNP